MIEINHSVYINEADISYTSTTSSGPGGQHVNKVETRVVLSLPLLCIVGLKERHIEKIKSEFPAYVVKENVLRIACQKHRSQFANKHAVTKKMITMLQRILVEKKQRKATKAPRSVKEKRLKEKKIRAQVKANRRNNDF